MLISLPAAMATLMLSALFVASGAQKFRDLDYFQGAIHDYRVLPQSWSSPVARLIAFIELAAGFAVLVPVMKTGALVLIAILLATYIVALSVNIFRGRRDLDCGCSGAGQPQGINGWLLFRNGMLILIVCLSATVQGPFDFGFLGWCLAFPGAVSALLFYHAFNQLVANHNLLGRIAHHG